MNSYKSVKKGFTLIELMIVIVILGLLASLVLPKIMGQGEKAKEKLICVQMNGIMSTLKLFNVDNGSYPTTEEGLEALVSNPDEEKYPNYAAGGYIEKGVPKDSWQTPFIYINDDGEIELISLGSDRKEGGEKTGKDIKFSECN